MRLYVKLQYKKITVNMDPEPASEKTMTLDKIQYRLYLEHNRER